MKVAIIITLIVLTPFIVIFAFSHYRLAKNIGTVMLAYAIGIGFSVLLTFTDFFTATQEESFHNISTLLMSISVLLAIPLMLFSADFKMWTQALPKTVIALLTAMVAVFVAVTASFFMFRGAGITDLSRVAGMMAGFYNGGAMNFFAVSRALGVNETTTVITLTAEMIQVFAFLVFITAGGYKLFRWMLPFKDKSLVVGKQKKVVLKDVENYHGMLSKKIFPKTMVGILLSLSFLVIGAGLSFLLTGTLNEMVVILTITTLAIAASFSKKVRDIPRTFEAGMFFVLIFSIIVASQFNFERFVDEALMIFLFVLCITLITIVLHLILCRLFKIPGDLYTVAIVAMLCSPPFIPPIVAAMENRKVLISGITIGLVGYATGTYIGIGMAHLLGLFY